MLLAANPAAAGLRAVYIDVAKAKQLQIDVYDNGDARIAEVGNEDYGLLIGGEFYIVDIEGGKPTVARLNDVATAMDRVLPPIFKGLFDMAADKTPRAELKIEPGEAGSAGGREGRVYHVRGLDSAKPEKATDYLISADPDLKPVGAALEAFMNAAIVPAAPLIGAGAAELIAETRTIFALGTPIDVGGRFRLNLAGKAAFPAAYFRLPTRPQSVDQLVAAMKLSMEKGPGPQ
ncbi:hypothetical protein COO09_06290 [Rhizorhabdus dicambivorans]|uniref:Uncharacterized protein n=2 Tax=Rhizorhabdus dicambivorans TaxID=1850238 RepID=A0A2A4G092_9SPHN|nr:hypothetical protein CMV14_01245 [Rhizorhabdus dicambivorans]PCE43407.1 hypothetical protein COO09_06290 [Rhizorhabdus dicambivorans]